MTKNRDNIKVCFPSVGKDLESEIDSRFGRAQNFLLVEIKDGKLLSFQAENNSGFNRGSGAGISAAEQVGELGANMLIAEKVGPKAQSVLDQLGIEVIGGSGIIKDVLAKHFKIF